MPVVGLTRVLPQVLSETRALMASQWPAAPAQPVATESSAHPTTESGA
jgi:ATP adenylyltransferase